MSIFSFKMSIYKGMQWGNVGSKDGVFVPALHGFVLLYFCLPPNDEKNFLTPSLPLKAPRRPTPPHKTLRFVNLPYNQYIFINENIFFNETYFINKNIIEIITKFIPSNQINFQKKLNNISKCLTRKSPKKKKKTHSITHNKIKAENHIGQNKIS